MAKKKSESDVSVTAGGGAGDAPAKPYVVLARKYRPQTFDDLIGQETMVQTLRNAFASGRIAHGFMLTGVRGVGKTTTARILARALNYETDTINQPTIDMPAPGRHCIEIMESRHPDVIEMDAASNTGVDNIREIIESARYRPLSARTKVFIIDEVHMLSKGAFNALLKTLEEPPGHVKFIFATTEVRKVPVTVLSRCQRFDLRRVDVPRLAEHLKSIVANEGASADDDALVLIARAAEGSVRDALSILDQAISTSFGGAGGGTVTAASVRALLGLADRGRIFDLLELLVTGEIAKALAALDALHHDGADATQILADLAEAVHVTARVKAVGPDAAGEGLALDEKRRASALGDRLSMPLLARLWQMLLKGLEEAGKAPNPLAAAEMVLIRIAHTADLPPPDEVIRMLGGAPATRRDGVPAQRAPERTGADVTAEATASDNEAPARFQSENPADFDFTADPSDDEAADEDDVRPAAAAGVSLRPLTTFAEVVALVGDRRDAKLKIALEEQVSLVRYDGAAGAIDLFLLPGAAPDLANDLREKLNKWTGRRWIVALSKTPGERPIGEVRRERAAQEIAALKRHPAVAAVLEAFPDAEVTPVPLKPRERDDDSATG
ncbi:DNA polymerase III subunit gamma/tau [Hyphomicrobium sp. CS1GBMeth3]|uniref:DNA polymerase III subunit gamma/tau n=1 Tax=Hyphomicrobium sp. CS1GBMeth3 TaxID=1892845 RepID=UPI000930FE59|nr:DNA polymerase III subunit gamma/tau [Hyphomicrobium sp. CS1GBMeth3]